MQMYTPRRDSRFEYVWEAMAFIERKQCFQCVLRNTDSEYTMCNEVAQYFLRADGDFEPIPHVEDHGNNRSGIKCRMFMREMPTL